jgi:hypothetical protein
MTSHSSSAGFAIVASSLSAGTVAEPARSEATLPRLGVGEKLRLIGEVLSFYGRVRRRLRHGTLETTLAYLRDTEREPVAPEIDRRRLGLRLGRATIRTLTPLPTDSRCLMRSLVLTGLLARRDIDAKLVLAVRPGEDFAAHAWVELEGRPLLEPGNEALGRLVEL